MVTDQLPLRNPLTQKEIDWRLEVNPGQAGCATILRSGMKLTLPLAGSRTKVPVVDPDPPDTARHGPMRAVGGGESD
jgi:hypothetical protein